MAQGVAFKIPTKVGDQITQEYKYKDESGTVITAEKVILDTEEVNWAELVGQEIINLLNSGQLTLPSATSVTINLRRESLTDQLESNKYTYNLNSPAKAGKFMVYLNGLNTTEYVELSGDGESFTFAAEYPSDIFEDSTLFVDYIEVE
jgi:hypothetical protein